VLLHPDSHVKVTVAPPLAPLPPLAGHLEAGSGLYTGRDLHREGLGIPHHAVAPAGGAGIFHHTPLAVAVAAGLADTEEPLLEPHLACATAGGTDLGLGAGLGAAAAALAAPLAKGNLNLLLGPEGRLFEAEFQVVLEIVAPSAATPPGTAPEDIAKNVTENVTKGGAGSKTAEASRGKASGAEPRMAELVVLGPFLGIGENLVGLGDLLELLLGLLVPGVLVRVVLDGQLAECLLDLGVRGVAVDFEDLVVVAFFCQGISFGANGSGPGAQREPPLYPWPFSLQPVIFDYFLSSFTSSKSASTTFSPPLAPVSPAASAPGWAAPSAWALA